MCEGVEVSFEIMLRANCGTCIYIWLLQDSCDSFSYKVVLKKKLKSYLFQIKSIKFDNKILAKGFK